MIGEKHVSVFVCNKISYVTPDVINNPDSYINFDESYSVGWISMLNKRSCRAV
jgi:hypothetical protein